MRSAQEILEILQIALPDLARDFHVTRLALFGSYARGQQTEASDVDILVEVDPSIGLRFVDRPLLVVTSAGAGWRSGSNLCSAFTRTWSPAGPSPLGTGQSSKRSWSMSRRPAGLLIEDMLERIRRIERSVAGMDHQAFLRNDTAIDAVIRNRTVIGEAANRLPQEFKDRHVDIPWHRIVGLRHRVVHDYFDVDLDLVWAIVETELPQLAAQLSDIQTSADTGGEQEYDGRDPDQDC